MKRQESMVHLRAIQSEGSAVHFEHDLSTTGPRIVGVHRQKTLGITLTYVVITSSGVNCVLKNSKGR